MKLKLGHADYTVRAATPEEAEGIDGRYNRTAQEIIIEPSQKPSRQVEVLIHELIHGCFEMSGIDHTPRNTEEAVCTGLDGPLTAILKDNRHLFRVLERALFHNVPIVGPGSEGSPVVVAVPGDLSAVIATFHGADVAGPQPAIRMN